MSCRPRGRPGHARTLKSVPDVHGHAVVMEHTSGIVEAGRDTDGRHAGQAGRHSHHIMRVRNIRAHGGSIIDERRH